MVLVGLSMLYIVWGVLLGVARFVARGRMDRPLRRRGPYRYDDQDEDVDDRVRPAGS